MGWRIIGAGNYGALRKGTIRGLSLLAKFALRRDGRRAGCDTVFRVSGARAGSWRQEIIRKSRGLRAKLKKRYEEQTDIPYGAARGWVDAVIQPPDARVFFFFFFFYFLVRLLQYVSRPRQGAVSYGRRAVKALASIGAGDNAACWKRFVNEQSQFPVPFPIFVAEVASFQSLTLTGLVTSKGLW